MATVVKRNALAHFAPNSIGCFKCESNSLLKNAERLLRFSIPKGAASQIVLHPELSLAIRNRIRRSDVVFILVTPFCRLRRWVDFEISVAATTPTKTIAVVPDGRATQDFYIDCHAVVPLQPERIREALLHTATRKVNVRGSDVS